MIEDPSQEQAPSQGDCDAPATRLIYDDSSRLFRRWVARWSERSGPHTEFVAASGAAPEVFEQIGSNPQLPCLIQADGQVHHGAAAALAVRRSAGRFDWTAWAYDSLPGVAVIIEAMFRVITFMRGPIGLAAMVMWGSPTAARTCMLTRWVFLRGLGLTFLIAFLSLRGQIPGLCGDNGIVPAKSMYALWANEAGSAEPTVQAWLKHPSLGWLWSDAGALELMCDIGTVAALLVVIGIAAAPALLACWMLYLTLSWSCTPFTDFQWDSLLLEAGLIGAMWAPWNLRPGLRHEGKPSWLGLWSVRWLLLKLMIGSGLVKILSNDGTWLDRPRGPRLRFDDLPWGDLFKPGDALHYHYFTQPLPTPIAWHVHQWPDAVQRISVGGMFFIELILPLLIVLPRLPRGVSFAGLAVLQVLIAATGNYTFFNFLTLALCFSLLDDGMFSRFMPQRTRMALDFGERARRGITRRLLATLTIPVLLAIAATGTIEAVHRVEAEDLVPRSLESAITKIRRATRPFRSANSYGLFAGMTTTRPELILEGSEDGVNWAAYTLPCQPGDPSRPLPVVAPHQPRLDWQMWFAALTVQHRNRVPMWLANLMDRLLEGSPEVLALFEVNPFPQGPPQVLRAVLYDYTFTTSSERSSSGHIWNRTRTRVVFQRSRRP
jgi:hypothetical protein